MAPDNSAELNTDSEAANGSARTLRVELGTRSYDIHVGQGLLQRAGALLQPVLRQPRAVIITDENVAPLYLDQLKTPLDQYSIAANSITLPAGEATKSFAQVESLIDKLLEQKIERGTALIALGGGVIGDLTGFTAATALRGIPFVQIPTTLLAQVDSSVGGKTGINTPRGKNLVGAFYQPQLVIADIDLLDTLPRREVLAGYAEIVKYGLIRDPAFFGWCEANGRALVAGDKAAREYAVYESCAAKAEVVAADETEAGERALLNFGHTFGHALEAETGFGEKLLHGEAVAIGMMLAFSLSVRLGLCPAADAARVSAHFEDAGLPGSPSDVGGIVWETDELIRHMASDKKVEDGQLTFVLAKGIGQAFITKDVATADIQQILAEAIAA